MLHLVVVLLAVGLVEGGQPGLGGQLGPELLLQFPLALSGLPQLLRQGLGAPLQIGI